jgi:hypothetical protein
VPAGAFAPFQQSTIDSARGVTNPIEQRAAEIRNMADDGGTQQARPTDGTSNEGYDQGGYGKEGKQSLAPNAPLQTNRWHLWAVGTGLFGQYDNSFNNQRYSAGQFTIGLDYRVKSHWLIGVIADYTYMSGTLNAQDFNGNTLRGGHSIHHSGMEVGTEPSPG